MNDIELNDYSTYVPVSFRVLGIGESTANIIDQVQRFGYDSVSASVIDNASESIPTHEDLLVIIVATRHEDTADKIAMRFHDAGVLTIGLAHHADWHCYDSVLKGRSSDDYPEIIKSLLQPVVTPGYICYDFHDLRNTLRDTAFFTVINTVGDSVDAALANMQKEFKSINFKNVKSLSVHLFFNRKRSVPVRMKDIEPLSNMISSFPESVNIIWSLHYDDTLPSEQIVLSTILAGKSATNTLIHNGL